MPAEAPAGRVTTEDEFVYRFSAVAFLLFAVRDVFTGSIRYVFTLVHVDFIWFIPDVMAFALFAYFVIDQFQKRQNLFGILLVLSFVFSTIVGAVFMGGSAVGVFSAVKMFAPVFAGLTFFGRSITESRWARGVLLFAFFASAIGLIVSPHVNFPWSGQTIDAYGIERSASKLWWEAGGVRYGGFAGDSTMAAFMVIFPYFLLHRYYRLWVNVALWLIALWAVEVSTSKTALIILVFFPLLSLLLWGKGPLENRIGRLRALARLSFITVLVPPLCIILIGGVDLASISSTLFSFADRVNNSWQLPFVYMLKAFPAGLFLGCGMGCFSYPMTYTSMDIYDVPVDNFYLSTYLMMGYPWIVFVLLIVFAVGRMSNAAKLIALILFNIYSVTVQCYGPSFATLMFGYAISDMFGLRAASHAAGGRVRRLGPALRARGADHLGDGAATPAQ